MCDLTVSLDALEVSRAALRERVRRCRARRFKPCLDCGLLLFRSAFAVDRSRSDGRYVYCRDCHLKQRQSRKLGLRLRVLMPLTPEMSDRVIALRQRLKFRRIDLAAHIGCGEAAIGRIERGAWRNVTKELWEAIETFERMN